MGKINLINQKFGRLTVIDDSNKKYPSNGEIIWNCLCDCGKKVEVRSSKLRNGSVKSCGCLRKEIDYKQIKDLTNQKFGKLTALSRLNEQDKNNRSYLWLCQCDCGKYIKVNANRLTTNHTQSCGNCNSSKGELKIFSLLKENNINFETQKTFNTCRFPNTNYLAKYDFYLNDYNLLIEYDGEQHTQYRKDNSFWNNQEEFKKIKYRDEYKNQWAKENNIKLKRISYKDYNKINLNFILE